MSENEFIDKIDSNQVISGIYKIENLINHKVYIGQSIDIYKRWNEHKYSAFNKKLKIYNIPIYRAIRKYGLDNFSFDIIKETNDLNYWEIFLIQIYHATDSNHGYNLSEGGYFGTKRKFIKCIESEEVYSSKQWVKMGYHDVCEVANNKQKSCHNLHFEYTTKEEYENFESIKNKIEYELKRKTNEVVREKIVYAKCIETNEIHSNQEWIKLGYLWVNTILNTTKQCHGKHFIKVVKLENGEYKECLDNMNIKGISIKDGKLNEKDKLKIQTKDLIYAKCIETNDIASIKEWSKYGYNAVREVINYKAKSCKGKHFVKVSKEEYIEYKNDKFDKLDFEERNKIIKETVYAKCIESGEIYDTYTWYKLGYTNIYSVLNNVNTSCKNLHFIQVSESDFNEYNEICSDKEVRINKRKELTKFKEILYIKCIETNEVHSNSEWKLLGFVALDSTLCKRSNYHNLHFTRVDKSEYEDYKKLNFDFYINKKFYDKYLKPKEIIYAKCVETSEIRTTTEWWNLGYTHVKLVLNGERERNKGLHFIKSTKEEYESYLKQLSSESA